MNKTIVIAGDSWGTGERSSDRLDPLCLHPGLAQYLLDSGYQVINLSRTGGSNINSADRIEDFLKNNRHLKISCVIVFQTEWLRDLFIEKTSTITEDMTHGYHNFKNRLLSRFYYRLSWASVDNNLPIHIVGGCGDTIWLDNFENEYPGVHIACQSLTNLLLENNHRIQDPVHCLFSSYLEEQIDYVKQHIGTADLALLIKDLDLGLSRSKVWRQNKEYFWPDGSHANRQGHRVLFEFLKAQNVL